MGKWTNGVHNHGLDGRELHLIIPDPRSIGAESGLPNFRVARHPFTISSGWGGTWADCRFRSDRWTATGTTRRSASYTVPFRSDASSWPLCFQYSKPKPLKTRLDFELVFG